MSEVDDDKRLYNAPFLEIVQKSRSFDEFLQLTDLLDVKEFVVDALGFLGRSVTGPIEKPVVFVRIPKCATTSVRRAVTRLYRSVWCFDGHGIHSVNHGACDEAAEAKGQTTWEMRRSAAAYLMGHPDAQYVEGHFEINATLLEEFGDRYTFITLLRHPVDRWISHYLYNVHLPRERYDINQSMEEFVETSRGRGIAQMYTAYLSGTGGMTPETRDTEEVRQQARENLSNFDHVGIVEQMESFEERLSNEVGVNLNVPRRNKSPAPEGADDISEEMREKIREVSAADMELYEYAKSELT